MQNEKDYKVANRFLQISNLKNSPVKNPKNSEELFLKIILKISILIFKQSAIIQNILRRSDIYFNSLRQKLTENYRLECSKIYLFYYFISCSANQKQMKKNMPNF